MADKRPLCKLCKERHWLREPHAKPLGYAGALEMMPGAPPISDAILIDRGPVCSNCERLEREIAYLKERLGERVTISPSITVTGVTETLRVTRKGRPRSGNALTPAEKQRAYRERHS